LQGLTYVLDEPTIASPATSAWGQKGRVVYQEELDGLMGCQDSIIGRHLRGVECPL